MGVAERRAQEKENIRSLILQAAQRLFVEKGIEQTNIRSIADAIHYSVGTVYVYFKSKNAILHAMHTQGFIQLGSRFNVLTNVADPMECLKAMGRMYIHFAIQNPDMYELMLTIKAPMDFLEEINQDQWDEGKATFDVLRATVRQCMEAGHFGGHQLEPLTFMIWSLVHGMCSLQIGHRAKHVDLQSPDTIAEKAYEEFLLMLDKL